MTLLNNLYTITFLECDLQHDWILAYEIVKMSCHLSKTNFRNYNLKYIMYIGYNGSGHFQLVLGREIMAVEELSFQNQKDKNSNTIFIFASSASNKELCLYLDA